MLWWVFLSNLFVLGAWTACNVRNKAIIFLTPHVVLVVPCWGTAICCVQRCPSNSLLGIICHFAESQIQKNQSIAMSPAHSRMEVNDRAQKLADLEDKHEHHTLAKFTETKSALEVGIFFFANRGIEKRRKRNWKNDLFNKTCGFVTFACTSKVAGQRKQQLALEVGEARKMKAESIFCGKRNLRMSGFWILNISWYHNINK